MHGPASIGGASLTTSLASTSTASTKPTALEESKETNSEKMSENRTAPSQNPLPSASPEGVGESVNVLA